MTRPVVVLGSTGSIGTQTLEVATGLGLEVCALAAQTPGRSLAAQARQFPDAVVVVAGGSRSERTAFQKDLGRKVQFGPEAVAAAAATKNAIVINGIVGAEGLRSTLAALDVGNRVGLANKESLIAGGPVVKASLATGGGELLPVDSEHSAIHQCLVGENVESVARLTLTASGGPFRGWDRKDLAAVTPDQALQHPTWDMGPRITIDSATLFNKGFEVIEAHYLFDVGYDQIDVVVHPQSIVHSMVEFVDGSWKGHLGQTDMRIPIQYAITSPQRAPGLAPPFDLAGLSLGFEAPDRHSFPALDLAYAAGRDAGSSPAVLNAADEVAVAAFLAGRIGFLDIATVVGATLDAVERIDLTSLEEVVAVDRESRAVAESLIASAS